MAYRHTVISNLKYVDEVFHNIAHNIPHPNEQGYDGQDDNTLLKWECVDDRFSTGFGSTYEVPINDFPKREEEVEITIFGDTWLHVEEVPYEEHYFSSWESAENTIKTGRVLFKESLPEVLQRIYPNGTVNLVGDFSSSANIEIGLDDVWNYLQGLSNYPDYFIFNGATKTLGIKGKDYTIQKIKDIDNFCKQNKIKACCIFTENIVTKDVLLKDWAETFSVTTKMLKFSIAEWARHHCNVVEWFKDKDGGETVFDYLYINKGVDLTVSLDITEENNELNYYIVNGVYKELIYTKIKRFILNELFYLHRECFYISFLYHNMLAALSGSIYDDYFGTNSRGYNLMCSFLSDEHIIPVSGDPLIIGHHQTKYGEDSHWNIFKKHGQFMAICLHTSYSEGLWAWQQGQSSCYQEWNQLRTYSRKHTQTGLFDRDTKTPANLMPERVYYTGDIIAEAHKVSPPIFYGTGCSMFTISEENKKRYNSNINKVNNDVIKNYPIDIWITRDNNVASITIRLRTEEGHQDLYQSIEFGKMDVRETENYIYPLYCGGGATGLSSDIYVYTPITGGPKVHIEGNICDLDMNNICMSNSNILHPTKFWNCDFTNFKILTPEGIWRSVYAHEQTASVVPYPSLGPPPDYAVHLNPPTHNLGRSQDGAYPFLMQNWNSIGSQHIKNRNWLCREPVDNKKYSFSSRLDAIRVGLNHNIGHGQYLNYGTIPHCWRFWDKEIPSGEFIANGKKYLAVPCGWDGRLWDYGYHLAIHNDTWDFDEVVNEFEKYYYKQNARIEDKLIIELGDANV